MENPPIQPDRASRPKIGLVYITDPQKRRVTFTKRKVGLLRKAAQLAGLTGSDVLLVIRTDAGGVHVYDSGAFGDVVRQLTDGASTVSRPAALAVTAAAAAAPTLDMLGPPPLSAYELACARTPVPVMPHISLDPDH